ncbi:hypothetical protein QN277_009440 [Acacia crassicarpa]|nr:hypothetical protein QN277_009440 [Acacia crassicarpa]
MIINTLLFLLFLLHHASSRSLNRITPSQPLRDGDVLLSDTATFALGFFTLSNTSRNRYVGIWYNKVSIQSVVWVANRDNPLNDTSGVLSINTHRNVVVSLSNTRTTGLNPVWSSNGSFSSSSSITNTFAKLLDTGNLVLIEEDGGIQRILWQSFDYPCDTMMPFMKLGIDRKTGLNRFLTSWKSSDDPGFGNVTYRINPTGYPQLYMYRNGNPIWRVGSWTGKRWSGVPDMTPNFIFTVAFVNNATEVTVMYGVNDPSVFTRMVLENSGQVRRTTWQTQEHRWFEIWKGPKEDCDNFRRCGSNSNCNPYNPQTFECVCLPGFEPKNPREWYLRDGSAGCLRKKNVSTCRSGEGFVKLTRVKVPDTSKARVDLSLSMKACREKCLGDCSCASYTTANESSFTGCMTWHADMEDIRTYSSVGQDLYVRVDAVELAKYRKKPFGSLGMKGMISLLVVSILLVLFLVMSFIYCLIKNKKQARKHSKNLFNYSFENSLSMDDFSSGKNLDLPLFDLIDIAAATENFSDANKLGHGGFGSVYKGLLSNGMEIAVKRLSKYSGQGIEEFKNEVVLIAKLQHRNLVRILGCCIHGEEKMLIYEYLPNKSLDFFIFDRESKLQLNWRKRFDIICGIARGILYLHQDSRLRIIHRDLKASNVLLDSELKPKIADFGMARIFGGDQIEINTKRVVGTYGYMSPEYAMEGLFSVKSDVYSFGVLLLEIVTSKKNSGHYEEITSTLVGHIWDLWREDRAVEIVDPSLLVDDDACPNEILKCIQIGLLCVQDYAADRPTMSTVVSMLGNDSSLPSPKQPAFIFKRNKPGDKSNPSTSEGFNSVNGMSTTMVEAR